ncbi:hypothetical protein A2707_05580 [Candidatus Saccharibacteria bacterium RIFCSPHIGHO2_01_FULL_45_15]|nr:MAG: hypothetical protein A2707_05580 [Candidatus Saccharibacteria bacterium RIFCSPHIGHO2_01_FULL_45_15]OGL28917.1 MAG: hypothetical protein A3C39_05795 [Candidatus Saccharibacteria bacterium RIFCSPHIGHO2_02_FULL_46_12]OGL31930.1 MAG: hypothetical protein A3E76_01525 [Candidatus Saccharibacteria bacterium RIFCSPHIGHO2_12_FULL_44_22]
MQKKNLKPRRWIALAVLVLPVLLTSMDFSILYLAAPAINTDLSPTSSQSLWILDIYGFVLAGLLITAGNLSDKFGQRKVLLIGATLFGLASLAAAFSSTPEMLIAARALMGLGGATLMPSTLALIRHLFTDSRERAKAIGVWTAAFAGGGIIGPIIGGGLLSVFSWGSVFLINIPFLIVLLVAAPILIPEVRHASKARLDIPGALLSVATIFLFVYGIKHMAEKMNWDIFGILAMIASAVLLTFFVRRLRTVKNPLFDVVLFKNRQFSVAIMTLMIAMVVLLGSNMYTAQYLQLVLGMSPLAAALWMSPIALSGIVGSIVGSQLTMTLRPKLALSSCFAVAIAGLSILALLFMFSGVGTVLVGSVLLSTGLTAVMAIATNIVIAGVPAKRAGAASAIQETSSELGGALGIAFLGSLGAFIYKMELEPHNVSVVAQDSLASAVKLSRVTSDVELLDTATAAFTTGFSAVAAICAVVMVLFTVWIRGIVTGKK